MNTVATGDAENKSAHSGMSFKEMKKKIKQLGKTRVQSGGGDKSPSASEQDKPPLMERVDEEALRQQTDLLKVRGSQPASGDASVKSLSIGERAFK